MNKYRPDLRMKLLNWLCCDNCDENLVSQPAGFFAVSCERCCIFRCQDCISTESAKIVCNCGSPMNGYSVLISLIALLHGPVEELRLIELPVRTSSAFHKCGNNGELFRYSFQRILCQNCAGSSSNNKSCWPLSSPSEELFLKLMAEFWSITKAPSLDAQNADGTPFAIVLTCPKCSRPCDYEACNLHCSYCKSTILLNCMCLIMFLSVQVEIPRNQLKFLTYTKWMDLFSCSECKDQYQELYVKCFAVKGDLKHNSLTQICTFFNNTPPSSSTATTSITFAQILREEAALHQATFTRNTKRTNVPFGTNTTDPTSYKNISTLSLGNKVQAPTVITCKCGRADDLKDMFYCQTCSEYGICGVCVVRNHKAHEIEDTVDSTIMSLVGKYSEKSLKKIMSWAEEYRQVDRESEEAYGKLCDLMGAHLKKAATCGDVERCAEVLSKCDITKVERHIKVLLHAKKKALHEIEEFCRQLDK